jgi:hypothetical protein
MFLREDMDRPTKVLEEGEKGAEGEGESLTEVVLEEEQRIAEEVEREGGAGGAMASPGWENWCFGVARWRLCSPMYTSRWATVTGTGGRASGLYTPLLPMTQRRISQHRSYTTSVLPDS